MRDHGLHRAGMRDIARAAGLSTGNLYYYFRNKQELVYACQDRALDRLLDVLGSARASGPTRPSGWARSSKATCRCVMSGGASLHLDLDGLPKPLFKKIVQKRDKYERGVRDLIADGPAPGHGARRASRSCRRSRCWARSTGWRAGIGPGRAIPTRSSTASREQLCRGLSVATDLIPLGDATLRQKARLSLPVNGEPRELLVDGYKTLLEVLREELQLTGTKHGCELGECGACAVLLDGELVLSCLVAAVECDGRSGRDGGGDAGAAPSSIRCRRASPTTAPRSAATARPAFCWRPRSCSSARPDASRAEIAEALSGQLCRCTGYLQIFEAVEAAAAQLRKPRAHMSNVIGKPLRRVDGRAKVTGQTRFADDLSLPGMLHLKLLRSTVPHARIARRRRRARRRAAGRQAGADRPRLPHPVRHPAGVAGRARAVHR